MAGLRDLEVCVDQKADKPIGQQCYPIQWTPALRTPA